MKKIIYCLAFIGVISASTALICCQTPAQKEEDAQANVQDANAQPKETKQEVNVEYPAFKKNAEEQIAINETHIAELRSKLSDSGKAPLDRVRKQKIDNLEKRNSDLRSRLYGYETEQSDWEVFKNGFNTDMDKLHNAFTDFGNDLKK